MDIQEVLCDRRIISSELDIISSTSVFVGTRVPLQTFLDKQLWNLVNKLLFDVFITSDNKLA
ncbi:hypothetical protein [Nostoc sp. NZL]|uniref:hypothetical protein n=1 Tax=Nostoc sp. NZL TaxID=2650612 RepID=UPI0018C70971|nr:hypothetical protein [Nostoc sp. NZL]